MRPSTLLIALVPLSALAQPPKFDTILYGASYYHEYMPEERLEKDVQLMQQAGLTFIRVGESTWSSWEPREGEFQSDWMQRILDRLHKAGIKVVLGTPTYSIPPWLYQKHPEIVVSQASASPPLGRNRHEPTYPWRVPPGGYGIRQNTDLTHPTYRWYAERVIRAVISRFKDHPTVIGYQLDNETHPNPTSARNMHIDFVNYLRKKYGDVEALNKVWGFVYWGQLVNGWDDFPPREGILNPGYKLEWERYQQKTVTDFLAWQAKIVREYKRPDQFITHDWPGSLRTNVNQYEVAQHLDVVSVNPYHPVQDRLDGEFISLCGDLTRSQKQSNYLVAETNAQSIGWDSRTQFPPYDGQLRLSAYSHVASGANMVAYWHWHSLHYGQETYWKGLLSHDLEPNRIYQEASRIGAEFRRLGGKLANFRQKNDVGILVSLDSYHGIQFMPIDDRVNYLTVLNQMYGALYDLNVGVDFIFPERPDFSAYKLVVAPPLYVASDDLLKKIAGYVEGGGHVVMAFKSGFANEHSTVRWEKSPGPLRKAAGFYYQEFSTLAEPLALKGDPFGAGEDNRVSIWAEMIIPETADALAVYDHPFFGRYPAVTRNKYGRGTLTYEGAYLSNPLQRKVLLGVLELAGITGPDQHLPERVRVKKGTNNAGKTMRFYLNYSGGSQTFEYPYGVGQEIVSGKAMARAQLLTLRPWDLAIVEEQ
jgi:beta-galactosidase